MENTPITKTVGEVAAEMNVDAADVVNAALDTPTNGTPTHHRFTDVGAAIIDIHLAKQVQENAQLVQATAVALRGVMPHVLCNSEQAEASINRAKKALRVVETSHLTIDDIEDTHFDDYLQTRLDENVSEE